MADEDRKQIGLTDNGREVVAALTHQLGWFEEAQEAGRFALAYAIREGVQPGPTVGRVETRWSPDLFDPSGEIRSVLRAIYPETTTRIRLMEYLIDEGLRRIAARVETYQTLLILTRRWWQEPARRVQVGATGSGAGRG